MPSANSLTAYLKKARDQGMSDDMIRSSLSSSGWSADQISMALDSTSDKLVPPPPPPSATTHVPHGYMWVAFQHILLFIALYIVSTAEALVLHLFVDKWVPGITTDRYSVLSSATVTASLLRGYIAALIVGYPIFAFLFIKTNAALLANPLLRNLRSRKFLIYFTLVVTFLIMIINLIGTVLSLLNGNISTNFVLHLLVTFTITGLIFGYYLNEVKVDRETND